MNPILYRAILASQAAAFDPDAVALFAAMTVQPNAARKTLISDTIVALKAAGVWTLLDAVWFMAAHDEQASRLNWKAPASFTLSEQGVITFTADRGWQGNGTTGYLDTGWTPSVHGVNYKLNDASFGAYMRQHSGTNARTLMGARDLASGSSSRMSILLTVTSTIARVNTGTNLNQASVGSIANGLNVARRSASNSQFVFRNGVSVATGSATSQGVPQFAFYIAATNNGADAVEEFDDRQFSFAYTGASMSEAQQLALYNNVQAYMTAVGAAV
jgi:hypothetical protein